MHISSLHASILIYNSLGHIDSLFLNLCFINDYGNLQKNKPLCRSFSGRHI